MMAKTASLNIAVYLDGRPGHEKQTIGILQQLAKRRAVKQVEYRVSKQPIMVHLFQLARFLVTSRKPFSNQEAKIDLVIGTGTHTHLPMLSVKKACGVPVVTCMTPASYLVGEFDLIFAPVHDNPPDRHNFFRTVGPPNICENIGQHDTDQVLILLGGEDKKSHFWDEDTLLEAVAALVDTYPEKRFTLSTSPRTPEKTERALVELAQQRNNANCHLFADTRRGWVEEQYNRASDVWVTGDSISMVYEALSSGCNVGIIPVRWKRQQSKFIDSLIFLEKQGFIVTLDKYLNSNHGWTRTGELNEAARCADEILRRWG